MHGEINGNIRANVSVELHQPARVHGNIETPALVVAKGVVFEGQCKMENVAAEKPRSLPAMTPTPIK